MAGPLAGLKVLDFTRLLPGPFGTMILADLGAEVLRVEPANMPDLMAVMPPMDGCVSAAHRQINRGKRSMVLNLKHERGPEIVRRLVAEHDVLIEQFRPGVMKKLGVDYETLREANPGLVYCSITGYGQSGPYRDRAGHDLNYLALSGIMSYTGRREGGPLPLGIQVADQCAGGMNAVIAILAAIMHRDKTGEGQAIDIGMHDGSVYLAAMEAAIGMARGNDPGRETTLLNGGSYYDCYETADGRWLSIGGLEPQFFQAMVNALGRPELMSKHMALGKDGVYLKDELGKEFKKKTLAEWVEVFEKADACVEPVLTISEMVENEHVKARQMVVDIERPEGGSIRQIGSPFKMSATPPSYGLAGCAPGSHTDEVLQGAGFSADEIVALREEGAVK